jgi:hypothetical protein
MRRSRFIRGLGKRRHGKCGNADDNDFFLEVHV